MFAIKRLYGAERTVEMTLTDKDIETYKIIKHYMLESGFCPSIRELKTLLHKGSTQTIHSRLKHLEDYGLLIRKYDGSPVFKLAGMRYVIDETD